jgi:hypothetical protein
LQDACPVRHRQADIEHIWSAGQTAPHSPQLFWCPVVSRQALPQRVSPAAHPAPHWPWLHTCPLGQALPQLPQLTGSEEMSRQVPPHSAWPCVHAQAPSTQLWSARQRTSQAPQLVTSIEKFLH